MRKANIIRSIFWGIIALIMLTLGIIGLNYNNEIIKNQNGDIEKIVEIFNNNKTIKSYEERKTYMVASHDGKNIHIKYSSIENKEYIYKLKNGYLQTNLTKDDTIGRIILMVLTDSISVNNGNPEGKSYNVFNSNNIYQYKLKDGIEFTSHKNSYSVKVNLKTPIIKSTIDINENND